VTHPALSFLLVLFLLLVLPVWGWLDMRRLKRGDSAIGLTHSYVTTIVTMWLLALVSAILVPASALWMPPPGLAASTNLDVVPSVALVGVTVGMLIGLLVPVFLGRLKPQALARQMEPIRFLLPVTTSQRWLFVLVCLTAGIAEEWIYRGFVLHFLVAELPQLNAWLLVVVAAAMFGIAHAYQGKTGTILTSVLGLLFTLLYIGSGNLLLPMVLHTLIDLRILLLLPKVRAPAERG
jgi:CAAX protease family protein